MTTPPNKTPVTPGRMVIHPLRDFLAKEAASGSLLVVAAAFALGWANSPWKASYHDLWASMAGVQLAGHDLTLDLRHWVNDGLMTLFFFVVGLEIKRELAEGELNQPRRAALPVFAAFGGMIVPAILFALVNLSGPGAHGWGIPMATDIAMALGVLALVGSRVHPSLKLFLLSVAIVDDIGAIIVIAVFYSTAIDPTMLAASVALVGVVVVLNRIGVRHVGIYIVVGTVLWLTTHEAGVHATIAGVILGLLAPTKPFLPVELVDEALLADVSTLQAAQETVRLARASVSVVEWIEHHLHPWTSLVIVPLFAFANAGITLDGERLRQAVSSRVTLGVIVGLVGGKIIGVTAGTWFAVRARVTTLPEGLTWRAVVGVAALAGVGFTVSLFVANLAFDQEELESQAKIGVVMASLLAALVGTVLLRRLASGQRPCDLDTIAEP